MIAAYCVRDCLLRRGRFSRFSTEANSRLGKPSLRAVDYLAVVDSTRGAVDYSTRGALDYSTKRAVHYWNRIGPG